ncbi:TlpA family protein disulfide reductase [Halolamina sp.]|jgi:thiol-disulfide isomerase/thioredoxin|uniref:TlpA family protein disulfide reductase n=1 Tax=Halolamina sp. TaxID=1940283 RepID=UPI0035657F53
MDRRTFLATGSVTLTGSLTGCSGVLGRGESQEPVTLESVAVGLSPGGELLVHPDGAVALLDFFATWCAPCKPQMSTLRSIRETFDAESLYMLSITQETDTDAVKQFWQQYEGTWPVALDDELAASRRYDVTSIPTLVVLSADGTEQLRHVGLASERRLRDAAQEALEHSEA